MEEKISDMMVVEFGQLRLLTATKLLKNSTPPYKSLRIQCKRQLFLRGRSPRKSTPKNRRSRPFLRYDAQLPATRGPHPRRWLLCGISWLLWLVFIAIWTCRGFLRRLFAVCGVFLFLRLWGGYFEVKAAHWSTVLHAPTIIYLFRSTVVHVHVYIAVSWLVLLVITVTLPFHTHPRTTIFIIIIVYKSILYFLQHFLFFLTKITHLFSRITRTYFLDLYEILLMIWHSNLLIYPIILSFMKPHNHPPKPIPLTPIFLPLMTITQHIT